MNSLVAHKHIFTSCKTFFYRYDIIYISESFLDSTISDDDNILHMEGYNLIKADHPDTIKRTGVCLYLKKRV